MRKFNITVNGVAYEVEVEEVKADSVSAQPTIAQESKIEKTVPVAGTSAPVSGTKVKAPMPGTIIDVPVTEGQTVEKGSVLCILEAMKMENEIFAPVAGKVVSVNVKKGDTVANEALLFIIG